MSKARLERIRKKLRKTRDKTKDLLMATLANWQRLVVFKNMALPAAAARKSRLVLLAHYSAANTVHAYVFAMIDSFLQADCDVILISTSQCIEPAVINRLQALNVSVIVRRNIGYDFGSWRVAIDTYPEMTQDYATIIFANDSVYGPLTDLSPVLSAMEQREVDVWALLVSQERRRHLQTFFWAMTGRSVESGFFDYFWHRYYRFYSRRQTVIDRYELNLAEIAERQYGLRVGGCWDVADMLASSAASGATLLNKFNPMRDFWSQLLTSYNFPFIKRELFRQHPVGSLEYQEISRVIKSIDPDAWACFESHLCGLNG